MVFKEVTVTKRSESKINTFFKIALCALSNNDMSCDDIATATSFSSVTVGKVVSELLLSGILVSSRAETSKGRHAKLFSPSEDLRYAILHLSENNIRVSVYGKDGKNLFSSSKKLCDGLNHEENIALMLSQLKEEQQGYTAPAAVGLISHLSKPFATPQNYTRSPIIFTFDSSELARLRSSREFAKKKVLYVSANDKISFYKLYSKNGTNEKAEKIKELFARTRSPLFISEHISDIVASLTPNGYPDTIVIDSADPISANEISTKVSDILSSKYGISSFSDTEVISFDRMSFCESECFLLVRESFARELAEKFRR